MNTEVEFISDEEAMKAITGFAQACYNQGVKDTCIGVAIGAGLALTGIIVKILHEEYKSRKSKRDLKNQLMNSANLLKKSPNRGSFLLFFHERRRQ